MLQLDLSVVVVSYNTRDLLRRCLASVQRSADDCGLAWDLLVVDNASSDGSAAMVRSDFPSAKLFASAENLGFVRGNNLAVRQAEGECLLLINPDAELTEGALDGLLQFVNQHPAVACAGPRLQYGDGTFQHSAFHFPSLWQTYFDFFPRPARLLQSGLNGRYARGAYEGPPFRVDFVLGACMLLRRSALLGPAQTPQGLGATPAAEGRPPRVRNAVGLFDEGYFMYCEELDLCWRLFQGGWETWCVPHCLVVHHEAQSSRQARWRSYVTKWRSRQRFFGKYYPPWWLALNRLLVAMGLKATERRTRLAFDRGEIGQNELAESLKALEEVGALYS